MTRCRASPAPPARSVRSSAPTRADEMSTREFEELQRLIQQPRLLAPNRVFRIDAGGVPLERGKARCIRRTLIFRRNGPDQRPRHVSWDDHLTKGCVEWWSPAKGIYS